MLKLPDMGEILSKGQRQMKMRAGTVSSTSVYLDIRKCVGHCTLNKSQDEKAAVEAGTVTFENMLWEITGLLPPTIVSGMFPSHTRRRPPPCGDRGKVRQNEWKEDFTDTKEGITLFMCYKRFHLEPIKHLKITTNRCQKYLKYTTRDIIFFFFVFCCCCCRDSLKFVQDKTWKDLILPC